ncbi:MAG: hypothetical protein LBI02_03955, partial [Opitutaceae bacterium]|nr:hypothetical protein [Opitutaceae bacterium]
SVLASLSTGHAAVVEHPDGSLHRIDPAGPWTTLAAPAPPQRHPTPPGAPSTFRPVPRQAAPAPRHSAPAPPRATRFDSN